MKLRKRADQFLKQFETQGGTHTAYKQRIDHFVEFVGDRTLTREVTNEWVQARKQDLNSNSMRSYYRCIKQFLGWLFEMKYIQSIPLVKLVIERVDETDKIPITEEEHIKIMDYAFSVESHVWLYACAVAWATGMRLSDIALLEREHVNTTTRVLTRKTKKTKKKIEIPLSVNGFAAIMTEYDEESESIYVCSDMAREYLANQHHNLSSAFIRLAARAGVEGKSFHCYRHGFVTRLIENGATDQMIISMTGLSPKQLSTYAHPSIESKKKALQLT